MLWLHFNTDKMYYQKYCPPPPPFFSLKWDVLTKTILEKDRNSQKRYQKVARLYEKSWLSLEYLTDVSSGLLKKSNGSTTWICNCWLMHFFIHLEHLKSNCQLFITYKPCRESVRLLRIGYWFLLDPFKVIHGFSEVRRPQLESHWLRKFATE